MATTALDLITEALQELGVLNAAEVPSGDDAALGLSKLNQIIDNMNAERAAIYAEVFTTYTLTANLNPHTIGPTGQTYTVTQRPVSIDGANIIDNTVSPTVRFPLRVTSDYQDYLAVAVRGLTSPIPTVLYYDPAWPNGNIYLYPVPDTAYQLELMTRQLLSEYALTTTFSLPPGYKNALILTLAEDLQPAMHVPLAPKTEERAREARARIQGNNVPPARIQTRQAGMPGGSGGSGYNWRTGALG